MAITLNGTTGIDTPKLNALDLELGSVNVVERGSNANGEYVRFADGTQICTRNGLSSAVTFAATGSIFQSGALTWTYPASFAAAPSVSATERGGIGNTWAGLGAVADDVGTECRFSAFKSTGGAGTIAHKLLAVGRWF